MDQYKLSKYLPKTSKCPSACIKKMSIHLYENVHFLKTRKYYNTLALETKTRRNHGNQN